MRSRDKAMTPGKIGSDAPAENYFTLPQASKRKCDTVV